MKDDRRVREAHDRSRAAGREVLDTFDEPATKAKGVLREHKVTIEIVVLSIIGIMILVALANLVAVR